MIKNPDETVLQISQREEYNFPSGEIGEDGRTDSLAFLFNFFWGAETGFFF